MIINLIILNSHSTVFAFLNIIRFRGVMVSTQDFESCDPGSIPGGTFSHYSSVGRAVDCKSICRVFDSP